MADSVPGTYSVALRNLSHQVQKADRYLRIGENTLSARGPVVDVIDPTLDQLPGATVFVIPSGDFFSPIASSFIFRPKRSTPKIISSSRARATS